MSDKIYAVISGEIAESRKISQEQLGQVPDIIRDSFKEVNYENGQESKLVYEIIRMDEFLCLTAVPHSALRSLILLACKFRYKTHIELQIRSELRLSVGIGPIELFQNQLRESDGTAFRFADNGLRSMKRNQRLQITTEDDDMNEELGVACSFMDMLIHDWSDEQAEALYLSISGKNQTEISEALHISQPAVNRRLKAAHLEAVEKFLTRYTSLLCK
ncbi:MAG: hypothetical protein WD052_09800 [Bacteroidales bacterium]